jgi:hypothetical protein
MQRLMTPEEHYDALDEWLQEWCGVLGQSVNLD